MMNIRFWGVRGSIPAPISPFRIKSKISAIVEQITAEDLENAESRERFLSGLPPWLFGTVGGNTPCVSVTFNNEDGSLLDECIVFDCGSGIRELGVANDADKNKNWHYHIFLSHFHWDHLQGLLFFGPAYNAAAKLDFYSPISGLEKILSEQMGPPYFPIKYDAMSSIKTHHLMGKDVNICGRIINTKRMNHPGGSQAYSVNENGKRLIYATDTELTPGDFIKNEENTAFFNNADVIIIDCQYTLGEAIDKYNWGHSAFSLAVDFAANWGIKHMVMFHHDPGYDDNKIYGLLQSARWYMERMNLKGIEVSLAYEGLEISI